MQKIVYQGFCGTKVDYARDVEELPPEGKDYTIVSGNAAPIYGKHSPTKAEGQLDAGQAQSPIQLVRKIHEKFLKTELATAQINTLRPAGRSNLNSSAIFCRFFPSPLG